MRNPLKANILMPFRAWAVLFAMLAPLAPILAASASPCRWDNFAGMPGGQGNADGSGGEARFNYPSGIAIDANGNLVLADTDNNTIRKITPSGTVTTLAGKAGVEGFSDGTGAMARFRGPEAVAVDAGGNVYVADTNNGTIRKVTPAGVVTTLASSSGEDGYADGPQSAARFWRPQGIAVDSHGTVYVIDTGNHCVRKLTSAGIVTTLAGAGNPGSVDATGSAAQFNRPAAIAVDTVGNLYVADTENHTIRKVTAAGTVTTLAGNPECGGYADGAGSAAQFNKPAGIAVDANGNVYVADTANHTVRKVTPSGTVTTLAGNAGHPGCTDGPGTSARFRLPASVTVDSSGNAYVADSYNHAIRKITPDGGVTTPFGAENQGITDGAGTVARFKLPESVAVDAAGNVYIADSANATIRKSTPDGRVSTLAGTPGKTGTADGKAGEALFTRPAGIAVDAAGTVYVADSWSHTIRQITVGGIVTTLAGSPGAFGSADGKGCLARFNGPKGLVLDSRGYLYVADGGNHTIRKIAPNGGVSTLAGSPKNPGIADGRGTGAQFYYPNGIAFDTAGNLYVTDSWNHTIRKVTVDGVVTTLAGTPGKDGSIDGAGKTARFNRPSGIVVAQDGTVFVSDSENHTIRKVTPDGFVTTMAGETGVVGSASGIGGVASFSHPAGLAISAGGLFYLADQGNNRIAVGTPLP